jgi:dipeptidyl aminopeptidase/acylaminoacyl peptidase
MRAGSTIAPGRVALALWTAALLAAPPAAVATAAADPPTALTAERLWGLARLGEPAISPDGRLAVVPVTRFDVAANVGYTSLWLVPTSGSAPARPLTSGKQSDTSPAFSPDGRSVAFVSKRGDDEENQVYVIATDGGEARRVTNIPVGANAPMWFPDGRRIAFVAPIWIDLVRWEDQAARRRERAASRVIARSWERAPIRHWDRWLDEREPHLFSIDVADAAAQPVAITRLSGFHLSRREYDARSYHISPDGLMLAFVADVDRTGKDPNDDVIEIATCGCKPPRNLTADNPATDASPLYSPDGRWLALTRQSIKGFYDARRQLVVLDRRQPGAAPRDLSGSWDRSATGLRWLPDSRALIGSIDDAATLRVYRFDLDGRAPRALTTTSSFSGLAVASGGGASPTVVALRDSLSEPPTLVRLDLRSGGATRLTTFNDAALGALRLGRVESVSYAGARGEPIQMWVVYPPGFDPARRYPLYLLMHGGPHTAMLDATHWRWNSQVFASWGYVVAWHNFHGSSGFGEAFSDSINPDRISLPYEDTLLAAEWFAAKPWIDRERTAAGGGSYGGFLASALLGRPHPFKALVTHATVYNAFTQIAADTGATKNRFFESWERPGEFARYSPHTNAGNFATPTLVIQGESDYRVPSNHAIELFNTLQKRGVPSKLVYYPDEGHWILKPQNSIHWYATMREWLERYAPPGAR